MSIKVLVAEDDLDVHELVSDILEINFKNVQIERALDFESLLNKIRNSADLFNLVIISEAIGGEKPVSEVLNMLRSIHASLPERMVVLAANQGEVAVPEDFKHIPVIRKPFSLDGFGEIVQRVCAK